MPELNANIPAIECYVRGNYLRDQQDSHDKYFRVVVFGVASVVGRSPLFHFMMEDGGVWWRAPISAFCTKPGVPEVDIHDLVLWNSFSPNIAVTKFYALDGMRVSYIDRHKNNIGGKYLFTLDWSTPDYNTLDTGYSQNPGQHKCGHVIVRDDGNFAIQPNNRIHAYDPSFSTKPNENLIQRKVNTRTWDVEDAAKWITSDDDLYNYGVVNNPLNFTAQDLEPFFVAKKGPNDAETK
jgi:hypothetical protein